MGEPPERISTAEMLRAALIALFEQTTLSAKMWRGRGSADPPPRIGELNLNPPIPSTWKLSLFMIFATKDWMQGWELHRPSTWPSSSGGLWSCVRP